jgi:hypothetical protein
MKMKIRSVQLPEEESIPESDMNRFTFLISGERKIGKSSLCAQFPDTLFLMCEPGGKALKARIINIDRWEDVKSVVFQLCSQRDYCKTVVIDTGYMFYELCFDYCLRTMGIDKPSDESWGNAWKLIEREFRSVHSDLINAGFGLIITAHTEIKEVKKRDGVTYSKLTTQLGGQATRFYNGFVDILCHYNYDSNGKRELIIRGDDFVEAGTRTEENFFFSDGSPIMSIPMDFSGKKNPAKYAFEHLSDAFYNRLIKEGGKINLKGKRERK